MSPYARRVYVTALLMVTGLAFLSRLTQITPPHDDAVASQLGVSTTSSSGGLKPPDGSPMPGVLKAAATPVPIESLASWPSRTTVGVVSRRAVLVAVGAGAAIATQLITLDAAPHDSGIAPLIVGRTVSSLLIFFAVLFVRYKPDGGRVAETVAGRFQPWCT